MTPRLTRRGFVLGAPAALAACSSESIWAPDQAVNAAVYRSGGPASLTLITMKNAGSDNGAHTALIVDASQRVMFDPAGSFRLSVVPERNDVLFGITPQIEQVYISYHARETYYVITQKINVPPAIAELALQKVLANGAVSQASCTRATSAIIASLPGFDRIGRTWFPNNLAADFAGLPGVVTREFRESDADDKTIAVGALEAQIRTDP